MVVVFYGLTHQPLSFFCSMTKMHFSSPQDEPLREQSSDGSLFSHEQRYQGEQFLVRPLQSQHGRHRPQRFHLPKPLPPFIPARGQSNFDCTPQLPNPYRPYPTQRQNYVFLNQSAASTAMVNGLNMSPPSTISTTGDLPSTNFQSFLHSTAWKPDTLEPKVVQASTPQRYAQQNLMRKAFPCQPHCAPSAAAPLSAPAVGSFRCGAGG